MKHERIPGPDGDPSHDPIIALARKTVVDYVKKLEELGLCPVCGIGEFASYAIATHFVSMGCVKPDDAGVPQPDPELIANVAQFVVNDALGTLQAFVESGRDKL